MVFRQPPLMGVAGVAIGDARQVVWRVFVADVHNGEAVAVAVGVKANVFALVRFIWPVIDHALGVVGVGGAVTGAWAGMEGISQADDMQPAVAHITAHRISVRTVGINGNVVGAGDAAVVTGFGEGDRRVGHVAQLAQVEDLDAMQARAVSHDVGVVAVRFHVAPDAGDRGGGQVAQVDGVDGVADVHKSQAIGAPHQDVLFACVRVGPAPTVVAVAAANLADGHESQQVYVVAGECAGIAIYTGGKRQRFFSDWRFALPLLPQLPLPLC